MRQNQTYHLRWNSPTQRIKRILKASSSVYDNQVPGESPEIEISPLEKGVGERNMRVYFCERGKA